MYMGISRWKRLYNEMAEWRKSLIVEEVKLILGCNASRRIKVIKVTTIIYGLKNVTALTKSNQFGNGK